MATRPDNRHEHCIHADTLLGTIKPGEEVEGVSTLRVFHGTAKDFEKRIENGSCRG